MHCKLGFIFLSFHHMNLHFLANFTLQAVNGKAIPYQSSARTQSRRKGKEREGDRRRLKTYLVISTQRAAQIRAGPLLQVKYKPPKSNNTRPLLWCIFHPSRYTTLSHALRHIPVRRGGGDREGVRILL